MNCKVCSAVHNHNLRLRKLFNLSPADDRALGDRCEICGSPKNLAIDHDHKTGLVRGKLCGPCNKAISAFRENVRLMLRGVEYLSEPPAITKLGHAVYGLKGRVTNKAKTVRRLNRDHVQREIMLERPRCTHQGDLF